MKAYELLATPDKWTKGAFARDRFGEVVEANSPDAVCFCIHGAMGRCYRGYSEQLDQLRAKLDVAVVMDWHDAPERTHEEVLAVLKELDI